MVSPATPTTALVIDGIAAVISRPFRSFEDAQELADRIAANPADYLAVCSEFDVPGIFDLRRPPSVQDE